MQKSEAYQGWCAGRGNICYVRNSCKWQWFHWDRNKRSCQSFVQHCVRRRRYWLVSCQLWRMWVGDVWEYYWTWASQEDEDHPVWNTLLPADHENQLKILQNKRRTSEDSQNDLGPSICLGEMGQTKLIQKIFFQINFKMLQPKRCLIQQIFNGSSKQLIFFMKTVALFILLILFSQRSVEQKSYIMNEFFEPLLSRIEKLLDTNQL